MRTVRAPLFHRIISALALALTMSGCATVPGGGTVFRPFGGERHPAVIVLHTVSGLGRHEFEYARALSSHGYVAVTADYYARGGTDNIELAYEFLRSDPKVDPGRIGIVGFSQGADQALRFAQNALQTADRRVRAIVSYYIGPSVPGGPEAGHPPILFLHGDEDVHVHPARIRSYCESKARLHAVCEAHIYKGVRHAFDVPRSSYGAYDAGVSEDAFQRTLSFLGKHLGRDNNGDSRRSR